MWSGKLRGFCLVIAFTRALATTSSEGSGFSGAWTFGSGSVYGVAVDSASDIAVVGSTDASTFAGAAVVPGGTWNDLTVAKMNGTTGSTLWVAVAPSSGNSYGYGITADADGNFAMTGCFVGSWATFGNVTLSGPNHLGQRTIFVAKLSGATGEWLWAAKAGHDAASNAERWGRAIAADPAGDFGVAGYFAGATIAFGATTLSNTYMGHGQNEIFVAKVHGTTGEWLWATTAGGASTDEAQGIAALPSGDFAVTGYTRSGSNGSPVPFGQHTITDGGINDWWFAFVAKVSGHRAPPTYPLNATHSSHCRVRVCAVCHAAERSLGRVALGRERRNELPTDCCHSARQSNHGAPLGRPGHLRPVDSARRAGSLRRAGRGLHR